MKKILFLLLTAFVFTSTAVAQDQPDVQDEMQEELSQMMERLSESMEDMHLMLGDMHILVDTVMLKSFSMMPNLEELEKLEGLEHLEGLEELEKLEKLEGLEDLEELEKLGDIKFNLGGVFEMLNKQMSELSKEDWSELEKMFEEFGKNFENIAPKNSEKSKGLRKI